MAVRKRSTAAAGSTPRKPRAKAAPVAPVEQQRPYPLLTPAGEPVQVVHVAAELAPFARTGGLGEAVANLALEQVKAGLKVAVIMPLYPQVRTVVSDFVRVGDPFPVVVGARTEEVHLCESQSLRAREGEGKPRVYFVANAHFFDREGIYGDAGGDYPDSAERWGFFALAALNALPRIAEAPVMMHAHDWHAALAPAYLRAYDMGRPFYRKTYSTLTVHNAGYQGHFAAETLGKVGLP
ncbi:MAG: glycogen/starch synthase, partial [Gemmatimonadetes bacterium]|nr:glycogen/starch synthase [Gemmatimonadota bacterium]